MIRSIYIGFFLFAPLVGTAQPTLTLDECIASAKEYNKKIEAAEHGLQAANYDMRSARANFLPSFSATGTGLYSTADGNLDIAGGMLPVIGADGVPTGAAAYFPGINLGYETGWIYNAAIKVEQPHSDHLQAQAMWQQARETSFEARVDHYLRWLEYGKATGRID